MAQLMVSKEKKFMVIIDNGKELYHANYSPDIHDTEIRSCIIFAKMKGCKKLLQVVNGKIIDHLLEKE